MNYLRDLIHRLRLGESERRIAKDLHLSRQTVSKYRELAKAAGHLEPTCELPDVATLAFLGMCTWAYKWDPRIAAENPPEKMAKNLCDIFLGGLLRV